MQNGSGVVIPLEHYIDGPLDASTTLVFVHGWPDDHRLWNTQVETLAQEFRCVRIVLPGFSNQSPLPAGFLQITERLRLTLEPFGPVILIGHDWGAYISYLFESKYPTYVRRMITLDVGARLTPASWMHAVFLVSYQWWLILAWSLGRAWPSLGNAMSRSMARAGRAPAPEEVRYTMNYLYWCFWTQPKPLKKYSPQVPTLFVYGGRKPYMFHSPGWLEILRANPACKVVELESAGHWLTRDEPARVTKLIGDWARRPR